MKPFKNRQKAEEFVTSMVNLHQPPLPYLTASIFTDDSASKATASVVWGVHIQQRESRAVDLWVLFPSILETK